MMRWLLIVFFLVFTKIALLGDTIHLTVHQVEKGPVINGLLDDPVWEQAKSFSAFKMVLPETGVAPSERTEILILRDEKNLYFGVICYTGDPGIIAVTSLQKDQEKDGNDLVSILLDPFLDRRNAYVFAVNAKGARTDGLATRAQFRTDWDGIWDARSRLRKDGWSTEIKIPFKTISFNPRLTEWGVNVERYIPHKLETIRLSGISKDSIFYNPAEAALLTGIEGIKQGKGLTVKPYTGLEMARDYNGQSDRDWQVNYGFDVMKNFTPNLAGVFTYHTDFAETEVDERNINLTRFPLYFPEKRSFFLEGSEIFSFGSVASRMPRFIPFFSRRIGLFEEEQVPIDWGAKVYGKVGRTNIALLDVKTRAVDGVPSGNFLAGRVYQNIFSESKVGIIFTSGAPGTKDKNSLLGVDFKYATSRFFRDKNFALSGWWVHNWNSLKGGRHYGYGVKAEYPNDLLFINVDYNYFGDSLEPGLGFLPRNGVKNFNSMFRFSPRPSTGTMGRLLRQISAQSFAWIYWDLSGELESLRISFAPFTVINTESGDKIEYFYIMHREVLSEPFEVADNVIIPLGDYRYRRHQVQFRSAPHRRISGKIEYEFGNFYNGNLGQLKMEIDFKSGGHVKLGLEGVFVRADLPAGSFNENLYRGKADFFLNPDLGLSTNVQYDSVSENIGVNFRFKWRISPGNTIYLVYTKHWEKGYDPMARYRFLPYEDRGIFKIQLSWRP